MSSEPGEVEAGILDTFEQLGIKEPRTYAEKLAIYLARRLDQCQDDKPVPSIAQQLRLTMAEVRTQDKPTQSGIDALIDKQ